MVVTGFTEPTAAPAETDQQLQLQENRKRDAKSLLFIQGAMDDSIFPRISSTSTSKEAWDILKKEYHGDSKVISVNMGSLKHCLCKKMNLCKVICLRFLPLSIKMKLYG